MPRPTKRQKLDPLDSTTPDDTSGGFKINAAYAARFEHNKKREEIQRLEEKVARDGAADEDESSSDESEDDDAELLTPDLDDEIAETLQAIKRKDPKVFDPKSKFYREIEEAAEDDEEGEEERRKKEEKPMYLKDYHRKNLMDGVVVGDEDEDEEMPQTYAQEQAEMKKSIVGSMHAANNDEDDEGEEDDDVDFLRPKSKPTHDTLPIAHSLSKKAKPTPTITTADVATADADPETYLSNFMASRAWLPAPAPTTAYQPLDEDDSDEDARAEDFEAAYNLRFENPALSNARLTTFARETAAAASVRREAPNIRQRAREAKKAAKEAEKAQREEERKRLRNLKLEALEEKVDRIRDAAGLKGEVVDVSEWREVLEGDFDEEGWEKIMAKKFGEGYYQEADKAGGKKGAKKPKWDDDIDIEDLVPEFVDDLKTKPNITLSGDEEDGDEEMEDADGGVSLPAEDEDENADNDVDEAATTKKSKPRKTDRLRAKSEAKRTARLQRRQLESLVDADPTLSLPSAAAAPTSSGFRYRATSPTSFGLTPTDILLASDAQLNQFVGLKKMAHWRDGGKKAKERKKLSKKGRVREWRREVFGREDVDGLLKKGAEEQGGGGGGVDDGGKAGGEGGGKKKRKKNKKRKGAEKGGEIAA